MRKDYGVLRIEMSNRDLRYGVHQLEENATAFDHVFFVSVKLIEESSCSMDGSFHRENPTVIEYCNPNASKNFIKVWPRDQDFLLTGNTDTRVGCQPHAYHDSSKQLFFSLRFSFNYQGLITCFRGCDTRLSPVDPITRYGITSSDRWLRLMSVFDDAVRAPSIPFVADNFNPYWPCLFCFFTSPDELVSGPAHSDILAGYGER